MRINEKTKNWLIPVLVGISVALFMAPVSGLITGFAIASQITNLSIFGIITIGTALSAGLIAYGATRIFEKVF